MPLGPEYITNIAVAVKQYQFTRGRQFLYQCTDTSLQFAQLYVISRFISYFNTKQRPS